MTAEPQDKRRYLIAVVAIIGLIGLIGTFLAFTLPDDNVDPELPAANPNSTVGPVTVDSLCAADRVSRYAVQIRTPAELTATAAAARWVRRTETSQTTSTNDRTKLVAIGAPGNPPREVLTARKSKKGWRIFGTAACLDATSDKACAAETLTYDGVAYRHRTVPAGAGPGVAAYVGQVALKVCVSADGKSFASRGSVAPVTAYTANEQPASEALVIAEDDESPYLFVPVP